MCIEVTVTSDCHTQHAETICKMMEQAAKIRGTGIAKRRPEYIKQKIRNGQAVIALKKELPVGFCYIESWENQRYVANSGLIVHPDYRNTGLAKSIKERIFALSKEKFPSAKLFGITTSMAVMKINSQLGYKPVAFSELTNDDTFWEGCQGCKNYDILQRTQKKMCLCTGMVCDLSEITTNTKESKKDSWEKFKRFLKYKTRQIQRKSKQINSLKKNINHEK